MTTVKTRKLRTLRGSFTLTVWAVLGTAAAATVLGVCLWTGSAFSGVRSRTDSGFFGCDRTGYGVDKFICVTSEDEAEANRLDAARTGAILREVVLPNLAGGKRMSRRARQLNTGPGVGEDRLEYPGGFSVPVSVATYAVGHDVKARLSEVVRQSWVIRYRAAHRKPYGYEAFKQAVIEGTARDGARLRALGFKTMFRPNPMTGASEREDLAELERRARYWSTRPDSEMRAGAKAQG